MKLKEKFKQWLDTQPRYQIREVQLEVIADEYALSFLDWYNTSETCERYLRRHYPKNITMDGSHYKKVLEVNKELLEIFKKEKGL
jgi:ribonucleotide reductase alpha subunit